MKSELRCPDVRANVSAFLDGELERAERTAVETHLATCAECRAYADRIARVRHAVRLQTVEEVPDLTDEIERALVVTPIRSRRLAYARTAAVAAAAALLLFLGQPFDSGPNIATADDIVRRVRGAARSLSSYRATFDIVEHNWHRRVPLRRMTAEVWFAAPERFRLEVTDTTAYPSDEWPRNTVSLVASPRRWSITEPSTCPASSLPACALGAPTESRTIVDRQPFDGNSALPTDIAIPVETLSSTDALEVMDTSANRHQIAMTFAEAAPLVRALQAGGSWRPFHALDRVEIWIDSQTWFPYRFRVSAGNSPDRDLWAERVGIAAESPGSVLLEVRGRAFAEPGELRSSLFRPRVTGAVSSGRFESSEVSNSLIPGFTAGLDAYREGTVGGRSVASFSNGMAWLKVAELPDRGAAATYASGAEVVSLDDGEAFYIPASPVNGRRVDIYGDSGVRVESNLPRTELLRVASSLPVEGVVPDQMRTPDGTVLRRLTENEASDQALLPGSVPDGYEFVAAIEAKVITGDPTLSVYYRRAQTSLGSIRIVQAPGYASLPPSSEEFLNVRVDGTLARWSFERSELEWVDGSTYRSVAVPANDLATALLVAESLD